MQDIIISEVKPLDETHPFVHINPLIFRVAIEMGIEGATKNNEKNTNITVSESAQRKLKGASGNAGGLPPDPP